MRERRLKRYPRDDDSGFVFFLILLSLFFIYLSGCDSCLPPSWRVTEKRKAEIRVAMAHQSCICAIKVCTPAKIRECHDASERACAELELPKTCGNAEREGSCGQCVNGR